MTTVVYRDGVIAGDTALFDRGTYCGEAQKVWRRADGALAGGAGSAPAVFAFRDWFYMPPGSQWPEIITKDEDFDGFIAFGVGQVTSYFSNGNPVEITGPYIAAGSGFRVAMGALAMGATAKRAVEICAALDNMTRAPITVLKHFEDGAHAGAWPEPQDDGWG